MRGGLSLGRPFGVPVRVSVAGVAIAIAFAAFGLADEARLAGLGQREQVLLAVGGGLLLELAVLVHEIAHCVVARRLGLRVGGITLFPLGGLTEIESETTSPSREYYVAMAGPASSVLLAAGFAAAFLATRDAGTDWLGFDGTHQVLTPLLAWLAWTNGVLAAFNLLPGLPLDGGRILAAGVWQLSGRRATGTRAAAYSGYAVAAAGAVWALLGTGTSGNSGAGFAVYGLVLAAYLGAGARAAVRQAAVTERTPELSAGRLARRAVLVPGEVPLGEALRRATAAGVRAVVEVDGQGRPVAIMNGRAVDAMPEARRPWVPLSSVTRPITPELVVPALLSGEAVLDALRTAPASEYLVVRADGELVGVLATVDVAATLDPALLVRTGR